MKIYNCPCQVWPKIFKSKTDKTKYKSLSKKNKLNNKKAKLNSALLQWKTLPGNWRIRHSIANIWHFKNDEVPLSRLMSFEEGCFCSAPINAINNGSVLPSVCLFPLESKTLFEEFSERCKIHEKGNS